MNFLVPTVLDHVDHDIDNTVFSYIPNTAETAFFGLVKGLRNYLVGWKQEEILKLGSDISKEKLNAIMRIEPRVEKIAIKDVKLRTFITDDSSRDDMVAHVYDVTYGVVKNQKDNLVILDDSIVRGTTLKEEYFEDLRSIAS